MANPTIFSLSSDDFLGSPLPKKVLMPSARHRKRNPKYRSPINPLFHTNVTRRVRANRAVNERDGIKTKDCAIMEYVKLYNNSSPSATLVHISGAYEITAKYLMCLTNTPGRGPHSKWLDDRIVYSYSIIIKERRNTIEHGKKIHVFDPTVLNWMADNVQPSRKDGRGSETKR